MRFNPGKSYPHPVLRGEDDPEGDYPGCRFEIANPDSVVLVSGKGTGAKIHCKMEMTSVALADLVKRGEAQYGILIICSTTFFRKFQSASQNEISCEIQQGNLKDRVTVSPFLFATKNIPNFSSSEWHEDYLGTTVDLAEGAVLAEAHPYTYWAVDPDEDEISSIFALSEDKSVPVGQWAVNPDDEKIRLSFHPDTLELYQSAKKALQGAGKSYDMINAVFLPALIDVIHTVKSDPDDTYEGRRWYAVVEEKLEEAQRPRLDTPASDVAGDAQAILKAPFAHFSPISERH